ncbi:hypothetical protein [Nocardia jiangsuensis]|uniref:Uncharacterized protein n=1 Tax=Nocardia jiangsuensis TaxID=1691563 RepID=A0ABV8DSG9_9NOCA
MGGDGAGRKDDPPPALWAERLAESACWRVRVRVDGPHDDSGAVTVTTPVWSDGPAVTQMRGLVAEFGTLEPRTTGTALGFAHRHTARGRAPGVLAWLDRDPDGAANGGDRRPDGRRADRLPERRWPRTGSFVPRVCSASVHSATSHHARAAAAAGGPPAPTAGPPRCAGWTGRPRSRAPA